jgi:hypothetical protein
MRRRRHCSEPSAAKMVFQRPLVTAAARADDHQVAFVHQQARRFARFYPGWFSGKFHRASSPVSLVFAGSKDATSPKLAFRFQSYARTPTFKGDATALTLV